MSDQSPSLLNGTQVIASDGPQVTVSVVSHGHFRFLPLILDDLSRFREVAKVIVTVNVPELQFECPAAIKDRVLVVANAVPRGFGANHNAAFARCQTPYFCVLNPDVRIAHSPFPELLADLDEHCAALAAPLVVNADGVVEDSARVFPTPWNMLLRLTGVRDGRWASSPLRHLEHPDWIAGMFMLFRSEAFAKYYGFDERYFMYCEDTDFCARMRRGGEEFVLCNRVRVVHHARRASHRSFRHAWWHIRSMLRFWSRYRGGVAVRMNPAPGQPG